MRRGGASALREQLLVHRFAAIVDARPPRLRAVGQGHEQLGQLGVAMLLDEPGNGVAARGGCTADKRSSASARRCPTGELAVLGIP